MLGQFGENVVPLFAVADAGSHFHQLVGAERHVEFLRNAGGQAGRADENDGIAAMGQATEVLFCFSESC